MKLANTSLAIVLVAMFLWLNGCTCSFSLNEPGLITVVEPHTYLSEDPIALPDFDGDAENIYFYKNITRSLTRDYNVELMYGDQRKSPSCEYSVKIDVNPEFSGSWVNAIITFPGFLVFAPSWCSYYYEVQMNTKVDIKDKAGKVVATIEENPALEFTYMDFKRSFWAYTGWWMPGYGVTSLIASPFMTLYDNNADSDLQKGIGNLYGEFIADKIVVKLNMLNKDRTSPGISAMTMAD